MLKLLYHNIIENAIRRKRSIVIKEKNMLYFLLECSKLKAVVDVYLKGNLK